jgi:hypothetical protein
MAPLQYIIITLAVWRITHLLQAEDGPWDLVFKLRKAMGNSFWGSLMDCFYCLSIWVALPFALVQGRAFFDIFILWMSLSGGAILLEKISSPKTQ